MGDEVDRGPKGSGRLQIRRHVASPVERSVRKLDGRASQKLTDAEVFLTDELDADDVASLIQINCRQTVLASERNGSRHLRAAEAYIGGGYFGVDLDHRRAGGPNDERFNALLPNTR